MEYRKSQWRNLCRTVLTRMGEDLGAWNFRKLKIPGEDNEVIVSGNYNGISIYQKEEDEWIGHKLKGFEKSGRYLEVDEDNNIWVALGGDGVFRFKLDYETKELRKLAFYPISDFEGTQVLLSKVDGKIVVTSNFNSFTYANKEDGFNVSRMGEDYGYIPRILSYGEEKWYMNNDRVTIKDKDGVTILHELKDQLIPDVRNVFSLDNDHKLIPIFNGFALYSKQKKTTTERRESDVLIRNFVSVNSGKSYRMGAKIPFSDNDLKINYALV